MVIRGGYGLNYNQTEIAITRQRAPTTRPSSSTPGSTSSTPTSADPRILYATVASQPHLPLRLSRQPERRHRRLSTPPTCPLAGGAYGRRLSRPRPAHHLHPELLARYPARPRSTSSSPPSATRAAVSRHLTLQPAELRHRLRQRPGTEPPPHQRPASSPTPATANSNALLAGLKHQTSPAASRSTPNSSTPAPWTPAPVPLLSPTPIPTILSLAYGRSDFNIGKRLQALRPLAAHVLRTVNRAIATTLLNGWSVSGIYNIHSGFPFSLAL